MGLPTAAWAARGFCCALWSNRPGQRWENFTHATDELVIVLEGEVEFEVEGQVHRPAVGEELLIAAGKVHSGRNVGSTSSRAEGRPVAGSIEPLIVKFGGKVIIVCRKSANRLNLRLVFLSIMGKRPSA